MKYSIGVDVGGTNLRAAVVEMATGRLLTVHKAPTPSRDGPLTVIEHISQLVKQGVAASGVSLREISGVGVGIPGLVDLDRGVALVIPNLPGDWPTVPLQAALQERLGLPVRLINDVRAITLAEWRLGAGRGVDTLACYAIGTGVGGGVVVNGRLHLGISGSAGELGHQVVQVDGPACNCGGRGCLEVFANGSAIVAQGVQAVVQRRPTSIGARVGYDLNRITVSVIAQAAREGDALAQGIFERTGAYVGMAVCNTLLTISPRKVVFGGGVMAVGDLLLNPVRRFVREHVFLVPAHEVQLVAAELGDDAGVIGAALWAMMSDEPA
jgi:glucokinase